MSLIESPHTFTLNARRVTVLAFDDEPLLQVLRDRMGLVGTRFGCGLDQCGACRVMIDDRVAAACDTSMGSISGRTVTTVEGLNSETAGRLRQALERVQAGQCGACLSGIVVTLTHALETRRVHDEASLRAALDGNLCRCGSQPRIVEAALSVIEPAEASIRSR